MCSKLQCVVCDDPDSSENPIFICEDCNIGSHMLCYGIATSSDCVDPWWCSPCSSATYGAVCELCLKAGGALKKTTCGKWVHVLCALFTENVSFVNKNRMEPVNISNVLQENRGKKCSFCSKNCGICCKCSLSNCDNFLHVTCGKENDCLKENINPKNNKIIFEAYCRQHKRTESSRRISSASVVETLEAEGDQHETDRLNHDVIESIDIGSDTSEIDPDRAKNDNNIENDDGDGEIGNNRSLKSGDSFAVNLQNDADSPGKISIVGGMKNNNDNGSDIGAVPSNLSTIHESNDVTNNRSNSVGDADHSVTKTSYWWDYHVVPKKDEMQAELHAKNEKIDKLKIKTKKLKQKIQSLEEQNTNLEAQLHQLQIQMQKRLEVSKQSNADLKSEKLDIKLLKERITSKFSEDGTELIYANGVRVSAKLTRQLETISSDPDSDRIYINTHFFVVFPEKKIRKRIKNGMSREEVLSDFRQSARYEVMKDLFEYRVRRNGKGDLDARLRLFKLTFRTKLNNWWLKNGPKELTATK